MIQSLSFPNMFDRARTRVIEGKDATYSNLKLLLLTCKTSLYGDPYFGTNLRKFLFDQNNKVLRDIVTDSIYTAIQQFVPQILVNRKDITLTSDNTTLYINIKALNLVDFQNDLYNITLTGSEII